MGASIAAGVDGVTPEQRAEQWANACIAKAENYAVGVRAAQAKYAVYLRSHEPPRNSGEGTAVDGPMPLGEKDDAHEPA